MKKKLKKLTEKEALKLCADNGFVVGAKTELIKETITGTMPERISIINYVDICNTVLNKEVWGRCCVVINNITIIWSDKKGFIRKVAEQPTKEAIKAAEKDIDLHQKLLIENKELQFENERKAIVIREMNTEILRMKNLNDKEQQKICILENELLGEKSENSRLTNKFIHATQLLKSYL